MLEFTEHTMSEIENDDDCDQESKVREHRFLESLRLCLKNWMKKCCSDHHFLAHIPGAVIPD